MTSIGQLKNMPPDMRTRAIAEHGKLGRLALAHLASLGLANALEEVSTLQQILQELTAEPSKPGPPLDPEPWWVDEIGERGGRVSHAEWLSSRVERGIIYNLAQFRPREGYAQKEEDYA